MSRKVTSQKRAKTREQRRNRDLKKQKQQEELLERAEMEEPLDEESLLLEEDAPEDEIQKDYYEEGPTGWVEPAPTSFEELDDMRMAQEKAHQVNMVTYDVQDLVRNILRDSELEPSEKAARMAGVADEFATRVSSVMESDSMQKDLDLLQIEATLASYARNIGLIEKGVDWAADLFVKREVSYGERKDMPDSAFALVYKDGEKTVRKYLIHDKSHVRNALARAAQQIKGGGKGAEDARKALPKIRAAAKKFGIETGMEKSLMIEKDASGTWRWIGKPSNNFLDRQGDIISKEAHQNYCAWLDENPEMAPLFVKAHIPGTARQARADFWMEHEGALIMSGPLTENEAAELLTVQKQYDLGMSVHGDGLRLDPTDPRVITHYWLFEVSDLPVKDAANPFTKIEAMAKEADMNKEEKQKYLALYMGEDAAKSYLEKTETAQKALADAGLTSKAMGEEKPAEAAAPEAKPTEEKPAVPTDADALFKQIVERVGKEFGMDELSEAFAKFQGAAEKVELLEAVLQEMQKDRDEEMAEILTVPVARFSWMKENRPTDKKDNIIQKGSKDDEELEKAKPEAHWLAQVANVEPIMES